MARVFALTDLTSSPRASLFEGFTYGDGVELSFFVTETPPDRGPPLHVHPHAEVFLVLEGTARFTIDAEDVVLPSDHVVMVPPETPHRFVNTGDGVLRVISMQPSGEVHQANVEPGAPTRAEPRD